MRFDRTSTATISRASRDARMVIETSPPTDAPAVPTAGVLHPTRDIRARVRRCNVHVKRQKSRVERLPIRPLRASALKRRRRRTSNAPLTSGTSRRRHRGRRQWPGGLTIPVPLGRVAQWESARFTRERSQVRNTPRPLERPGSGARTRRHPQQRARSDSFGLSVSQRSLAVMERSRFSHGTHSQRGTVRHHPGKAESPLCGPSVTWARRVSNLRPLACEASALPLSYAPGWCIVGPRFGPGPPDNFGDGPLRVLLIRIGRCRQTDGRRACCSVTDQGDNDDRCRIRNGCLCDRPVGPARDRCP